jgi:hypothetical protein
MKRYKTHRGEMGNSYRMLEDFLGREHFGDAGTCGKAVITVNLSSV